MARFGNVISEILDTVFKEFLKQKKYQEIIIQFLCNELTLKKEIIPHSKIKSRHKLIVLMREILDILEEKLINADQLEQIKNKQASSITGIGFRTLENDENGAYLKFKIIPSNEMVYIPQTPKADLRQIFFKDFGNPIHGLMREENHNNLKQSKDELDYIFKTMLWTSFSLNEELYNLEIICKKEFDQIQGLLTALQFAHFNFCKSNKEVTRSDVINTYDKMEEESYLTADQCRFLKTESLKKEIITCANENCKRTFEKERSTQKYCNKCSNSPEYQKLRRKGLGDK